MILQNHNVKKKNWNQSEENDQASKEDKEAPCDQKASARPKKETHIKIHPHMRGVFIY